MKLFLPTAVISSQLWSFPADLIVTKWAETENPLPTALLAGAPWKICQRTHVSLAVSHCSLWLFLVQRRTIAHSNQRDVIDRAHNFVRVKQHVDRWNVVAKDWTFNKSTFFFLRGHNWFWYGRVGLCTARDVFRPFWQIAKTSFLAALANKRAFWQPFWQVIWLNYSPFLPFSQIKYSRWRKRAVENLKKSRLVK